jgi:hypothetical protein
MNANRAGSMTQSTLSNDDRTLTSDPDRPGFHQVVTVAPSTDITARQSLTTSPPSQSPYGIVDTMDGRLGANMYALRLSDVSLISEESENVIPYDIKQEILPDEPFFTDKFQNAIRGGIDIAKEAVASLDKCCQSIDAPDTLKELRTNTGALCPFQGSDTRTIAILGDSGEGMYIG